MQSQLEGDERREEVTYFTYAMTKRNNYMLYFCLGLIGLFREWPVLILKGVVLNLSVKQKGARIS